MTNNEKGVVLTVVIIVTLMVVLIAGYVMTMAYNQKRLSNAVSGRRIRAYYRAQAGVVDAQWRLRTNTTTGLVASPLSSGARDFNNPLFDPLPYSLNLTTNTMNVPNLETDDVIVNIEGAKGPSSDTAAPEFRVIESRGKDT